MKIINPLDITEDRIESSNLPDDGFQDWVAAGPPALPNSYPSAFPVGQSSLVLFGGGSSPPTPTIFDADGFSVTLAPSGPGDYRARQSHTPVSPDGQMVAFVTHGRKKLSVFSTADFSLIDSVDLFVSGDTVRSVPTVAFSTDSARIGVTFIDIPPFMQTMLPMLATYEVANLEPAGLDSLHPLYFLSGGHYPSASEHFDYQGLDGLQGFSGVEFSWDGPDSVVFGITSEDGNEFGRGVYSYDVVQKNPPVQRLDSSGKLFRYDFVSHNPVTGHTSVVQYDRASTETSQGRTSRFLVLDGGYSIISAPVEFSGGVRIDRLSHSGELAVVRANLSPFCRIYDGDDDYSLVNSYGEHFFALTLNTEYLYRSGATDYLAEYPSGGVVAGSGEPYAEGDTIIFEDGIYESLKDDNVDVPTAGEALDPPSWLFLGTRNELRLFNGLVNSQSVSDENGTIEVAIRPGEVANGVALLNLDSEFVRVKVEDPGEGLVYDSGEIEAIDSQAISDWYTYFFEPYLQLSEIVFTDLPSYPNALVTVELARPGGEAAVGEVVLGLVGVYGSTVYGSSVGILDFSTKGQDRFGNFSVIERAFSKRAEYDVYVEAGFTSGLQNALARFRATPVVWIGSDTRAETIVYGYYRDFDIVLGSPAYSECTITVEGL